MMGRAHAISGAAGWLVGCAALELAGVYTAPATEVIGTAVAAGAALLPDIDHPSSTVARSLGPVSRCLAKGVAAGGGALQRASCRCCAGRRSGGHRKVTHTWPAALGASGAVAAATSWWGDRAAVVVATAAIWLALHVAISARTRAEIGDVILPGEFRKRGKRSKAIAAFVGTALLAAVVAATLVYALPGRIGWWLGIAIGWGVLAHILGDMATLAGAPMFWPFSIGGRCRWTDYGSLRWLRFRAGGKAEKGFVVPTMVVAGVLAGVHLVSPGTITRAAGGLAAMATEAARRNVDDGR